jgi:tetratricopeptide (TPR) repeat protein
LAESATGNYCRWRNCRDGRPDDRETMGVVDSTAPAAVAVSKPVETKAVETKPSQQAVVPPVEKPPAEKAVVKKAAADTPAKPQKVTEAKAEPVEPPVEVVSEPPAPPSSADPASDAFNRGRDLVKSNEFGEAVQAFTKAADIRPSWVQAYLSRGNAYQKLEQFDAAIRDYSRAVRLDPKNFQGYLSRAQIYVRTEQDDPALADLNQATTPETRRPGRSVSPRRDLSAQEGL